MLMGVYRLTNATKRSVISRRVRRAASCFPTRSNSSPFAARTLFVPVPEAIEQRFRNALTAETESQPTFWERMRARFAYPPVRPRLPRLAWGTALASCLVLIALFLASPGNCNVLLLRSNGGPRGPHVYDPCSSAITGVAQPVRSARFFDVCPGFAAGRLSTPGLNCYGCPGASYRCGILCWIGVRHPAHYLSPTTRQHVVAWFRSKTGKRRCLSL